MFINFTLNEANEKLVGYEWKVSDPKAVVCLIHGIGEHAGRYDRIGEAFGKSGIALVSMDLRGHGFSSGKRGHTAPRESVLHDVDLLVEDSQKKYPEAPLFIYGHSMGGNIALDYRNRGRYRTLPLGFIVTSPWIILEQKVPGYLYFLARMIAKVKPNFQMDTKITNEILGNLNVISEQCNKHLVHGKISVQTVMDGIAVAEALLDNRLEKRGNETLRQLLLMHGDCDKICAVLGSRKIAQLEKELCKYIEWEGLFHEIHNGNTTNDGIEVIQTMIDWINTNTSGRQVSS